MLSKIRVVAPAVKRAFKPSTASLVRSMTTFQEKELGEETKYIRQMEAKKAEEMKAAVKLLVESQDEEQKKKLAELLGMKSDAPKTFLERYGLNDIAFALPVGMVVAIPLLANEIIIIDGELQLTACFGFFLAAMWKNVGPMLKGALLDYSGAEYANIKSVDEAIQSNIKSAIYENESTLTLKDDYKELYSLQDNLAVAQAEILNQAEEYKYRESIVKKLDSLHALEENASTKIRNRIINTVHSEVLDVFKNDKKAKENALNAAIAILEKGEGAKHGKDVVGDAFAAAIAKYKESYSKQAPGSDEILVQLEKDMAAVAQAPVVEGKGGNVYVTNPI